MFFKIGVLKSFAILERLFNKDAVILLRNTYGGCYWIFVVADTYFQLNLAFIADSRTGFCSRLLWKHEVNLRSSHCSCCVKKGVLRNFANFTGKYLCWSLFLLDFMKKRHQYRFFPVELTKFLRTTNSKSVNDCFWNLFFHLDYPF